MKKDDTEQKALNIFLSRLCGGEFGAVLIADSGNGQETHYAIKTITNKTAPKEFFVKKNGKWLPHANKKINAQLTEKFTEFMDLSDGRWDKTEQPNRLKLHFEDGMTKNRDPNAMLTVMKFDGIFNGQFIRVEYDEYFTRPFDLSSDWTAFEPSKDDKKQIDAFPRGVQRYLSKKTTAIKYQTMRKASVVFWWISATTLSQSQAKMTWL